MRRFCIYASPGVNLLLQENLKPVGVIGVSGDPSVVMSVAKVIKLTFESFYDYEVRRDFFPPASRGEMNRLARLFFVDRPVNLVQIRAVVAELGISEKISRYPILIEYSGRENAESVLQQFVHAFSQSDDHSVHDLLFTVGGSLLLLWKHLDESDISSRSRLCACIDGIDAWFRKKVPGSQNHYFCGTQQNHYLYYRQIYEDLVWLYRYPHKKEAKAYFLTDYLTEFLMSRISTDELAPLMETHIAQIRDQMDETVFQETVSALIETNMNLGKAADSLYLHKNTVASRVKKIKDLLGISPLTSVNDAIFITALYSYLSMA